MDRETEKNLFKTKSITINIRQDVLYFLRHYCEKNNFTLSDTISEILRQKIVDDFQNQDKGDK